MADARAEQILAAVLPLITGLATTGANVQRGRVYQHQAEKLPALSLIMGEDTPVSELQTGIIDWELSIQIEATVKAGLAALDATGTPFLDRDLNAIRKEVHLALLADHKLGLSFVHDIAPGPAARPILSGDGSTPTGSQALAFVILYRTSRADISEGS